MLNHNVKTKENIYIYNGLNCVLPFILASDISECECI